MLPVPAGSSACGCTGRSGCSRRASWAGSRRCFATIPIRNFFPGSPPPGSWVDVLVVLWVIVALTGGLLIGVAASLAKSPARVFSVFSLHLLKRFKNVCRFACLIWKAQTLDHSPDACAFVLGPLGWPRLVHDYRVFHHEAASECLTYNGGKRPNADRKGFSDRACMPLDVGDVGGWTAPRLRSVIIAARLSRRRFFWPKSFARRAINACGPADDAT